MDSTPPTTTEPVEELVDSAEVRPLEEADGDEDKIYKSEISSLYSRHLRVLSSALRKMYGDGPPDPDDISQLAFQKLLERRNLPKIRNLEAFLWRTARNLIFNEKRSANTRTQRDYEVEQIFFAGQGDTLDPERVVIAKEQIAALNKVLLEMPVKRRRAFVLHRVDGLNVAEVARQLGISRTAAVKHLARAFAQIDGVLKDQEKDALT